MAYIVPDDPSPTDRIVRLICVPPDALWQANIEGALSVLREAYVWDNENGTAEAAAETMDDIYFNFIGVSGDCVTELCTAIANCITTSTEVQAALAEQIANNPVLQAAIQQSLVNSGYPAGGGTPTVVSPDANDNNLLPPTYTCDNNHFFGMAMEMVEQIHNATVEVLQQIDSSAGNWLDLVNSILDNIPLFELIGLVTEVIDWYSDTISTAYNSAWSQVVQEELACDIFCRIKDDCNLSYDDFFQVYLDASGITAPPNDTFEAWWQIIQSAALGNDKQTVALVDLLGLLVMRFGGKFSKFAIGIRSFPDAIALAADATNPDWALLCNDCTDLCYEWDFTIDAQGWQVWSTGNRPFGVYVAGVGWQCTWNSVSGAGNDNRVYIENLNWLSNVAVDRMEAVVVPTAGGSNRSIGMNVMNGTSVVENQSATPATVVNSTPQTVGADFASTGDGLRMSAVTTTTTPDQDALTIQKIRIFYTSGQPEDGQQCT